MKTNLVKNKRRSIRLKEFDYSQPGMCFITICIKGRERLLGKIKDGEVLLSEVGHIVKNFCYKIPTKYPNVKINDFTIMPNHIHAIVEIHERRGEI